jgi:hypothetical protein
MEKFMSPKQPQAVFRNEPRRNTWADEREIELVNATPAAISNFISASPLFKDRNVAVDYFQTGISSVACLLTSDTDKWVLKMPLSPDEKSEEGHFLKTWESIGIRVPHVIDEGESLGRSYTLMDYIEAPPLIETMNGEEMIRQELFGQMGDLLRRMHAIPAEGYGRFRNGRGAQSSFSEWLSSSYQQERIRYVKENGLLNEQEHGSVDQAMDVLRNFIGGGSSVYCHYDFSSSHVFATTPLTVFDPEPAANHPVIDLARSVTLIPGAEKPLDMRAAAEQLIEGYEHTGSPIDRVVLHSAIVLQAYLKFRFWDKSGRQTKMKDIAGYLKSIK